VFQILGMTQAPDVFVAATPTRSRPEIACNAPLLLLVTLLQRGDQKA
jgi:hypothetical protein